MRKSTPIIAILGAIILLALVVLVARIVRGGAHFSGTMSSKVVADIASIDSACDHFAELNGGHYPDSLAVLMVRDQNGQNFLSLPHLPRDPWGRVHLYEPPATPNGRPRIWTHGRDGLPGGEGPDQDFDKRMPR